MTPTARKTPQAFEKKKGNKKKNRMRTATPVKINK
jgi:hypothetical protein